MKLRLGLTERLSLLALGGALAFSFLVVKPLEERSRLLLSRIHPEAAGGSDAKVAEIANDTGRRGSSGLISWRTSCTPDSASERDRLST